MATLNRGSFEPLYHQLARILRGKIETGALEPGKFLDSEPRLSQEYDVGKLTVRRAIGILRSEGLIETERGVGNRVRERRGRTMVNLQPGDRLIYRVPTADEQRDHDLAEVPVIVVTRADGSVEFHPPTVVEFEVQGSRDGEG